MLKCISNRNSGKSCDSITGAVERLESDLKRFKKFIDEADTRDYEDTDLSRHVVEVKEVTQRIEDLPDDYKIAVQQIPIEGAVKKFLRRLRCKSAMDPISKMFSDIKEDIEKIDKKDKSQGITERIRQIVEEANQIKLRRHINHEVEKVYIEIIDDIEKVVKMLMEPSGDSFISIFGQQAGSGKTIIAKKVYERVDVREHFKCLAWIDGDQESEDQTVLLRDLVKQLQKGASEEISDAPSTNVLPFLLEHNRCLIVVDHVRTLYDLRFLLRDVGRANKSMMSKVLITTRMTRVAEIGHFHSPRPWTQTESWDLLYKISKLDRPDAEMDMETARRLEPIGREIVDKCDKLPLNVATIGEILRSTPLTEWEKVRDLTYVYLTQGGASQEMSFADSYNSLPPRLKRCFPYMALFPKDEPVEATRLYHLWLAEGQIYEEDISPNETLMDVARSNLKQLVSCNMIEVVRRNEATEDIEWCKLDHLKKDLLHKKAKKEDFFETVHIDAIDQTAQTNAHILFNKKARRLVIPAGSGQCQDLNEMESLRVLLVYSDFTAIQTLRKFGSLKVLVFDGCSFPKKQLPKEIFNITTLLYLLLNPTHDIELPSDAPVFPSIQTLNLLGSHAIYVPNILGKMKKLKHLYLGYSCRPLASDKLQLEGLDELEVLDVRNGCMVKLEDVPGLINLQLLGINIDTEDISLGMKYISEMKAQPKWVRISTEFPVDYISVDAPDRLKMVLEFEKVNELVLKGTFKLPAYEQHFWKNVSRLSIEETVIEGDPMKLLKLLPNLKELRLEDDEFMTDEIECDANAFPELVSLKLKWCSHLKKWRVDQKAFLKLSSLTIIGCQDLKEIVPEDGLWNLQARPAFDFDIQYMPEDFQKYYFIKGTDSSEVRLHAQAQWRILKK